MSSNKAKIYIFWTGLPVWPFLNYEILYSHKKLPIILFFSLFNEQTFRDCSKKMFSVQNFRYKFEIFELKKKTKVATLIWELWYTFNLKKMSAKLESLCLEYKLFYRILFLCFDNIQNITLRFCITERSRHVEN